MISESTSLTLLFSSDVETNHAVLYVRIFSLYLLFKKIHNITTRMKSASLTVKMIHHRDFPREDSYIIFMPLRSMDHYTSFHSTIEVGPVYVQRWARTCLLCYPANTKHCITFVQRRPIVFDVGPTLYKCHTNVLCLLCWFGARSGSLHLAVTRNQGLQGFNQTGCLDPLPFYSM